MGEAAAHAWRPHRQQPSMLPSLRQAADGSVLPSELEALEQQELAAVAVKDYTLAAQLYATRMALTPRPLLQPADCAPATVEGQRDFFLQHGVRLALPTDPLPYRPTPLPTDLPAPPRAASFAALHTPRPSCAVLHRGGRLGRRGTTPRPGGVAQCSAARRAAVGRGEPRQQGRKG